MLVVRICVDGSILLAVAVVLSSRLGTPCEVVVDDEVRMLVDDQGILDVVMASCRMAVDVLFPWMIPYQNETGGARPGEDDESDTKSVIVVLRSVGALLLVEGDPDTLIARTAVLVVTKTDVWDGYCQQVKVDSSRL